MLKELILQILLVSFRATWRFSVAQSKMWNRLKRISAEARLKGSIGERAHPELTLQQGLLSNGAGPSSPLQVLWPLRYGWWLLCHDGGAAGPDSNERHCDPIARLHYLSIWGPFQKGGQGLTASSPLPHPAPPGSSILNSIPTSVIDSMCDLGQVIFCQLSIWIMGMIILPFSNPLSVLSG